MDEFEKCRTSTGKSYSRRNGIRAELMQVHQLSLFETLDRTLDHLNTQALDPTGSSTGRNASI